jgi:hypothetical protein
MLNSKSNIVIGIAIFITFSLIVANVQTEAFSQPVSNGNATRDVMGNFANFTNSTTTDIKGDLIKDYPTNTSK